MLQRQRDEIAKPTFRHRVLAWKETVVRIEAKLVTPLHCPGEDGCAKFSREAGGQRRIKENPNVTTASRARPFKGGGNVPFGAGLKKCPHVILPGRFVEIGSQKPARFIGQQRINPSRQFAGEMVVNYLIRQRKILLWLVGPLLERIAPYFSMRG